MKNGRKHKRVIEKPDYLGLRMPHEDKSRLELAAKREMRATSDLAWVLIREGLDRRDQQQQQYRPAV